MAHPPPGARRGPRSGPYAVHSASSRCCTKHGVRTHRLLSNDRVVWSYGRLRPDFRALCDQRMRAVRPRSMVRDGRFLHGCTATVGGCRNDQPTLSPSWPRPSARCCFTEPEHEAGDPPHLDLLRALGDAIAAVVAIDVLERGVPGVAQSAVHLHGPVGRLAAEAVRPVVAHRDLVRDGERRRTCPSARPSRGATPAASRTGCAARPGGTGSPWFVASGLPNGARTFRAYSTERSMQNCAAPRLEAAWRMRFSLKKRWTTPAPGLHRRRSASLRHADVGQPDVRAWSVGMLNVHRNSRISRPGLFGCGTRNAVMPSPSPAWPLVRANMRSWRRRGRRCSRSSRR